MTQKIYHKDKILCYLQKEFLLKNKFKVVLQYIFNVVILLTFFSLKLSFKLKMDPKACIFKNLGEIQQNLEKISQKNLATSLTTALTLTLTLILILTPTLTMTLTLTLCKTVTGVKLTLCVKTTLCKIDNLCKSGVMQK